MAIADLRDGFYQTALRHLEEWDRWDREPATRAHSSGLEEEIKQLREAYLHWHSAWRVLDAVESKYRNTDMNVALGLLRLAEDTLKGDSNASGS